MRAISDLPSRRDYCPALQVDNELPDDLAGTGGAVPAKQRGSYGKGQGLRTGRGGRMDLAVSSGNSESPCRRVIVGSDVVAHGQRPDIPGEVGTVLFLC